MSRPAPFRRALPFVVMIPLLAAGSGCARRQYNLGNDAMDEGHASEAIRHYLKALKRHPDNPDYLFALGQAYVRDGAWSKAVDVLSKAAEISPDRAEVLDQLAFAQVKLGNVPAAIDVYWRLFTLKQKSLPVFEKMRPLLESQGRYAEAVEAALMVSTQPKFDANRLFDLGKEYQRLGKLKEAEKLFTRGLELKPRQPVQWRTLGEIRLALDDGPGAADAFQQAYKLDPNDTTAAIGSAAALRRMGQIDQSLQIYQRVVELNPDLMEPRAALVELYLALGRTEEAAVNAREAYIRYPDDPGVQALKGAAHLARGEWLFAIKALELAQRSEYETRPWVVRMTGEAYLGLGERATARRYFIKTLNRNNEDGATYLDLCKLDLEDGREQQGIERCQKAMTFAPELRDEAVAAMTAYYERESRFQKAVEVEEKAPPAPRGATRKARTDASSGEGAAADARERVKDLNTLRDMLQSTPEEGRSAREWFELGEVSYKLEDMDTAEKALTRAWQGEPGNLQYRKRMASILLARGRFDSALVHFKEIIRTDERDIESRQALVQAYLGRGSAGDALEVLKELRELTPNDPKVYELSAEACFELGDQREGQEFQDKAVELRAKRR